MVFGACHFGFLVVIFSVLKKWFVDRYEFQMQYGSIGWSVGATLGYAQAVPEKRVISCIGDGSFQVCDFNQKENCFYFLILT